MDVAETIRTIKAGQIEYRVEKESGVIHAPVGKASFDRKSNQREHSSGDGCLGASRPSSIKGRYLKTIAVSSTMSVGIRLEPQQFG